MGGQRDKHKGAESSGMSLIIADIALTTRLFNP